LTTMLLRSARQVVARPQLRRAVVAPRFLSAGSDAPVATTDAEVVVPELVETLEWVVDSPPPIHQFEEPPIIVEIAGIEPASSRTTAV